MQRLIIVYNPNSSKHEKIEQEVIAPARELTGFVLGKFEVKPIPLHENAKNLAKILLDDDLVVTAGGDGTASMALNAILDSKKDATLAVLGYGNFNDFSRTLGNYHNITEILTDYQSQRAVNFYPLEAIADEKHYRYSACYFTLGMFAESTELFDKKTTRKSLKSGKKGLFYSIKELAKWYFKNKKHTFIPESLSINEKESRPSSDLLFVNGTTVAKIMKGGKYWKDQKTFLFSAKNLTHLSNLLVFMAKSIFHRIPGDLTKSAVSVSFTKPETLEIQGEGEYQKLTLKTVTIKKSKTPIKVLAR